MKILAALKKIKHLDRKIEKTSNRIAKWCSYIVENESDPPPVYNDKDIIKMQQQIGDWAMEKVRIRKALHLTNVRIKVSWDDRMCSIDELLLIQNVILPAQMDALKIMRRKEKGGGYGSTPTKDSYVVLQYDPRKRDMEVEKIDKAKEELDELLDNLNIETEVVGL